MPLGNGLRRTGRFALSARRRPEPTPESFTDRLRLGPVRDHDHFAVVDLVFQHQKPAVAVHHQRFARFLELLSIVTATLGLHLHLVKDAELRRAVVEVTSSHISIVKRPLKTVNCPTGQVFRKGNPPTLFPTFDKFGPGYYAFAEMNSVIVVRTANRPDILHCCIASSVEGCDVANAAHWIVLDDSSTLYEPQTRQVALRWKSLGLRLIYVDKTKEEKIAGSLRPPFFQRHFSKLVARSPSCPSEGGRNLGLVLGLSLHPRFLFFVDDDMVHRHDENCFFHLCAQSKRSDSFVVAPRKLGIVDMAYLSRLVTVLDRDDWAQLLSDKGISAASGSWYSPANPFWKHPEEASKPNQLEVPEKEVLSGQFMALHNNGTEWLPFPDEFNSDLNWSFLQSTCYGTPLLKVPGADVQHLPSSMGHPTAEAIVSELIGTAVTRSLRKMKPPRENLMTVLAADLPEILAGELKQELFLFSDVERAILSHIRRHEKEIAENLVIGKIETTVVEVAERLKAVDFRQLNRTSGPPTGPVHALGQPVQARTGPCEKGLARCSTLSGK